MVEVLDYQNLRTENQSMYLQVNQPIIYQEIINQHLNRRLMQEEQKMLLNHQQLMILHKISVKFLKILQQKNHIIEDIKIN